MACRLEGDIMLVEIRDTGPGIPPELQERIFEPFFTTKAPGQGFGLGLDYAMRIVRKHRGFISVNSEPGSPVSGCACRWSSCRHPDGLRRNSTIDQRRG